MYSVYCLKFIIFYCIYSVVNYNVESIQCRDQTGKVVDWYVLYKLPKISESSDPFIRDGIKYMYITSKTVSDGWLLSKVGINSMNSIPAKTLANLYKDSVSSRAMWIMYNDQPPKKQSNSRYGHAKGVVMTDKNRGYWLIHSVPNYPPIPRSGTQKRRFASKQSDSLNRQNINQYDDDPPDGRYGYPTSGTHYGQSFLCISLNSNQMNIVGLQLIYNQIISYRYNLPSALSKQFPSLVNASQRVRIENPPYNHRSEIQSTGGQPFISFAKSDKWQKDLYDDFVAPKLQTDLLAETWLNGPGKLPSDCTGAKVLNVQSIVLNKANVVFRSSRDHSKWAVTTNSGHNRNWVCIGDINRADTQFNRGGGTVCINLLQLWSNYRESVNDVEPCPRKTGFFEIVGSWICSYIC